MRKLIDVFIAPFGVSLVKRLSIKTKFRHSFVTLACSNDDVEPSHFLIETTCKAAQLAFSLKLDFSDRRGPATSNVLLNTFPGEHYRLLAALARITGGDIVEIGTYTGMGSLSLMSGLQNAGHVTTFDVLAWNQFETFLRPDDFSSTTLSQNIADLSDIRIFTHYLELLSKASIIFCDGPKDGRFEYQFLNNLATLRPHRKHQLLVLDDIRFPNMIDLWASIKSPKLDATSFGHFSGTGIVDISDGLLIK